MEQTGLRLVTPPPGRAAAARTGNQQQEAAGPARLEACHVEGLLLNLDASLRISTRPQFFTWTQGLLLNLIRHRILVCALRRSGGSTFAVDSFSTLVTAAGVLGEVLTREASLVSVLADKWAQHRFCPVLCRIDELAELASAAGPRELLRVGASELLVHGCHDVDGEVLALSVFACEPGTAGPRELYLAQLIYPSLHAAWVRTRTQTSPAAARPASTGSCVLTERERGILRWVYLGKSNGEIGAILGISSLTVKNHVQKILRKLNVVNRAQAVGRALDARIIMP